MKRSINLFRRLRLRSQLQLILSALVLLAIGVMGYLQYHARAADQLRTLQDQLRLLVQTAALQIDGDLHERITPDNFRTEPAFRELREQLIAIKRANHWPNEIYTLRPCRSGAPSPKTQTTTNMPQPKCSSGSVTSTVLQFVVMSNDLPDDDLFVGETYDLRTPMVPVLGRGESNVTGIYEDEHGHWISAYAPIRDSAGSVVALLQTDFRADDYFALLRADMRRIVLISLAALAICLVVGGFVSRGLVRPVERLTAAVARISRGDYDTALATNAHDEIACLTRAFDEMRVSLRDHIQQLNDTRAELVRAERLSAIGQMAGTIVHDFKNPMTVILGASSLLKMPMSEEARAKVLSIIEKNIRMMNNMTQDILDFTRGSVKLEKETVDLNTFLDQETENLNVGLGEGGIRLELEHQAPAQVSIDTARLSRAVGNIIRNSVEALRGNGLIRIASDQENGSARIHITDNGPGIPEAIRDHLFDPFVTSGKAGGTGLGTAISKSIVEAHGGRLDFNTETGKGTTFVITLPRISDNLGAAAA